MWNHLRLDVWQRARQLAIDVYAESSCWPVTETYGLTSQSRRAAVSIGANLAEGAGRGTHRVYAQFVGVALGSSNELDHLLSVARDAAIGDRARLDGLISENRAISRMLYSLRRSILEAGPLARRTDD